MSDQNNNFNERESDFYSQYRNLSKQVSESSDNPNINLRNRNMQNPNLFASLNSFSNKSRLNSPNTTNNTMDYGSLQPNQSMFANPNIHQNNSPNFVRHQADSTEIWIQNHGEELKKYFDDIMAVKKKFERIGSQRHLSPLEKSEFSVNETKYQIFMEKCGKYVRPRKNGVGKFSVEDFVNFNMPVAQAAKKFQEKKDNNSKLDHFKMDFKKRMASQGLSPAPIDEVVTSAIPSVGPRNSNGRWGETQISGPMAFRNGIPFSQEKYSEELASVLESFDMRQKELNKHKYNCINSVLAPQNVVLATMASKAQETSPPEAAFLNKRDRRQSFQKPGEFKYLKEPSFTPPNSSRIPKSPNLAKSFEKESKKVVPDRIQKISYSIEKNSDYRESLQITGGLCTKEDGLGLTECENILISLDSFLHEIVANACSLASSKPSKSISVDDFKLTIEKLCTPEKFEERKKVIKNSKKNLY